MTDISFDTIFLVTQLRSGEKVEISAFFKTEKSCFLRKRMSSEKMFSSQEQDMATLSNGKKNFEVEATQLQILKFFPFRFFLPSTVAADKMVQKISPRYEKCSKSFTESKKRNCKHSQWLQACFFETWIFIEKNFFDFFCRNFCR